MLLKMSRTNGNIDLKLFASALYSDGRQIESRSSHRYSLKAQLHRTFMKVDAIL